MHRKKRKKEKKRTEKRQYNQPSSTFSFSLFSLASYVTCACALHSFTRLTHHQAENQLFLLLFQPIIVKPLRS